MIFGGLIGETISPERSETEGVVINIDDMTKRKFQDYKLSGMHCYGNQHGTTANGYLVALITIYRYDIHKWTFRIAKICPQKKTWVIMSNLG